MRFTRPTFRFVAEAGIFSAAVMLLAGCGSSPSSTAGEIAAVLLSGNWQISSSAPTASSLPALSGESAAPAPTPPLSFTPTPPAPAPPRRSSRS